MFFRRFVPVFVAFFLTSISPAFGRETAPDWLSTLSRTPITVPAKEADAVVLLDEATVDIGKDGTFTTRVRWAVRIQTRAGRSHAVARVNYDANSMKVRAFKAWLLPAAGEVRTYAKKRIVDVAVYANALELYGEARRQAIVATDEAEPGSVFGYEAVYTESSIFSQRVWAFQDDIPVERSSITLNLPPGWDAAGRTFNHEPITPLVKGLSRSWTLTGLAALEPEPRAPSRQARVPWLAIDVRPPTTGARVNLLTFTSWEGVSAYFTPKYNTASAWDPAMKAKADALTAGATSTWDRIRALCAYVQRVNYISINLNAATAGGMIPRPAARVFQCNYGDCKDKTTLLRALLDSQGIAAHPVVVYSGEATHVREEWPSPMQFNHCILAIAVDDTVDVPAAVTHPTFGRLVFFDPTSSLTPPGLLAASSLGGFGLVLAGEQGGLVRLPSMLPGRNRVERHIEARLAADGSVSGTITETFHGHASTDVRDELRERSTTAYNQMIERWLANSLPTPTAMRVTPADAFEDARFDLAIDFQAPSYGKHMRDVLLVFKPVLVARRDSTRFRKEKRTQPVIFEPYTFRERAEIALPAGYRIDEKIAPVELTTAFGRYTAQATEAGGRLVFERALNIEAATIPAADYETVRVFFEKILQTEQSPVVLERL